MNREILTEGLKLSLRKLSLEDFSHMFINEAQAIEEFYKLCHNIKCGNTISLLFNPHRLSTDNEKDDLSVYESLQDDNKISGLARLYLYNLEHGVNNAFYSAIQRGYQNIQYINEFPPFVARTIYNAYLPKTNERKYILDPCAGWGGRMIGCASVPNTTYVGFDPSTKTYEGLLKLGEWLKTLQPTFEYHVYKLPFEDAGLEVGYYDIAFTSPPYYNTEHYSEEETNSLNRYTTFDKWVDRFYTPLIDKAVSAIKDDAVFIFNVGDRKYPLSETLMDHCALRGLQCERIEDYLSGNGEGKEKFYCISRKKKIIKKSKLF